MQVKECQEKMSAEKIICRECNLCNVEQETCGLTGRKITLDSLRQCKKGIKRILMEKTNQQ